MNDNPAKYKLVEADSIKKGPIRHRALSLSFLTRALLIYEVLRGVMGMPFEEFIDNFLRDIEPDRELDVWEHIAGTYTLLLRKWDQPAPELFDQLIVWSMLSTPETATDPSLAPYRNSLPEYFSSLVMSQDKT
jgi:hypothetical protein